MDHLLFAGPCSGHRKGEGSVSAVLVWRWTADIGQIIIQKHISFLGVGCAQREMWVGGWMQLVGVRGPEWSRGSEEMALS